MEQPTLLLLNDDCLLHIFKFLEIKDGMNLANTCHRLRNLAVKAYTKKYQKITVEIECKYQRSIKTKRELMSMLSLIGGIVKSLKYISKSLFVIEILKKFPNLKELKLDKEFVTS